MMSDRVYRKYRPQRLPVADAEPFSRFRAIFRAASAVLLRCMAVFLLTWHAVSCGSPAPSPDSGSMEYAQWFDLQGDKAIITSPYGGKADTLEKGLELAYSSIDSGAALAKLHALTA